MHPNPLPPRVICLTVTASVWFVAFPPMEATIGIKMAKGINAFKVSSNWAITNDAKIAVIKFMKSQNALF